MDDMRRKGRDFPPPHYVGERNPAAKLTADDVKTIRNLLPTHTQQEIGRMFGVHQTTVSLIATGRKWGWLR